jgi:Mrp family chromosome partitioning ATPase
MRRSLNQPTYQDLQLKQIDQTMQIASLEERVRQLDQQLVEAKTRLAQFNLNAPQIEQLERELVVEEAGFLECAKSLDRVYLDRALGAEKVSTVSVVDPASVPVSRIKPRTKFMTVLGLLIGLLAGTGVAYAVGHLNPSMQYREDVEGATGFPVLATIPFVREYRRRHARSKRSRSSVDTLSATAKIMTNGARSVSVEADVVRRWTDHIRVLLSRESATPPRVIGVTSCFLGEGVSTIAKSLAYGLSHDTNGSVLYVPADAIKRVDQEGSVRFTVSAKGTEDENHRAHTARSPKELLESLRQDHDFLVIDLPPLLERSRASQFSSALDGVLLVIESGRVSPGAAERCLEMLDGFGSTVFGVVLNKHRDPVPEFLDRLV